MGTDVATRALLKAHSVSVLLSAYRRTLMTKYSAQNILLGTHGIFTTDSISARFCDARQSRSSHPGVRTLGDI